MCDHIRLVLIPKMSWMAPQASHRCCLTNMRMQMVSGLRLAHHNEIVSQAPEKIHSAATAKPLEI